jgi:hypothetical protein
LKVRDGRQTGQRGAEGLGLGEDPGRGLPSRETAHAGFLSGRKWQPDRQIRTRAGDAKATVEKSAGKGYEGGTAFESAAQFRKFSTMPVKIFRFFANLVILTGLLLLAKVMSHAANGALVDRVLTGPHGHGLLPQALALGLSLGVPLHVISVGWVLQRKWLPPLWARTAQVAAVVSGCWLGAALGIKALVLR